MKSPITKKTTAPLYYGSDLKTEVKQTITENDGFTTLEIARQYTYKNTYESNENIAEVKKTTADIFIRNRADAVLDDNTWKYGDMFSDSWGKRKVFKSVKHAMNALPRKLQTEDYRTRELILTIVIWEDQTASVFVISE